MATLTPLSTKDRQDYLHPYKAGTKRWKDLYSMAGPDIFLDEHMKNDLMLYGEAAQATYDTVDLQQWSRFRDGSRFDPANLLNKERLYSESHFAELPYTDYTAAVDPKGNTELAKEDPNITYMHASEKSDIIRSVVRKIPGQKITDARVWIGYVAYSEERQDILVAWRGTQRPHEWLADGNLKQVRYTKYKCTEGQTPGAATKRRWWNPLPLLGKVIKKAFVGLLAGGFALVSTAVTPLLGLLLVLTSPPQMPQDFNSQRWTWKWIKAAAMTYLVKYPAKVIIRLVVAAGVVGVLAIVHLAFPSTLNLAAFLLTLPFAFVGAIGFVHVVLPAVLKVLFWPAPAVLAWLTNLARKVRGENDNLPCFVYVGAVAIGDVALRILHPPFLHGFWATPLGISSFTFAVSSLLPMTLAGAIRAGAQAGETDEEDKVQVWVHEGFYELYTKHQGEYNKQTDRVTNDAEQPLISAKVPPEMASPQTTLHRRIKELMKAHPNKVSTISVTGHSLGGALAVLSSFDLVKSGCNVAGVDPATDQNIYIPVTCYSFEGPRVGNLEFAAEYDRLKDQGLTAIRIVNKPDIVPDVPRAFYLQNVYYVLGALLNQGDAFGRAVNWVEEAGYWFGFPTCYRHVGTEITVDSRQVKWLKKMEGVNPFANGGLIRTYHNLEVVLHVLSGYNPRGFVNPANRTGFGSRFTRDFALANKSGDNLNPRFGIAPKWHSTIVDKVVAAKYVRDEPVPPKPPAESPAKAPAKPDPDAEANAYLEAFRDHHDGKNPEPLEGLAGPEVDAYLKELRADANRYNEKWQPAIIQPYDATQSPPDWGADQERVVGQGPQNPAPGNPKRPSNLWLEDIHAWDQATFDKHYGLKTPVEEEDVSPIGGDPSA